MTFQMPVGDARSVRQPSRHGRSRIVSLGMEAQRVLSGLEEARVMAVFKNSLYLRSGDAWACLGHPIIGRGPLNITCETADGVDWREMVLPDDVPRPQGGGFSLGTLALSTAGAALWLPHLEPLRATRQLEQGFDALISGLPVDLPRQGLAFYLCGRASVYDSVARAARQPIEELVDWLRQESRGRSLSPAVRGAVRSLLGLGPGLTPSGDDFLAGLVVGLRAAGRRADARGLGREITALAPCHTNEISAAHLIAALRAGLSEDLHDLIRAVLRGDAAAIGGGLLRLAGTTHWSTWDALAGAATAFRCVLGKPALTCPPDQARRR